jgi:putative ABC transport system permease protein
MMPRPPRLAEALLRRVLPPGARGLSIIGDLAEEFAERPRMARFWYWRQAGLLALRYGCSRGRSRALGLRARSPMSDLFRDLRLAARALLRSPGTSALIIGTLAVAIGSTTVGFTFIDLAVLRGMPVDDPKAVVYLWSIDPRQGHDRAPVSLADFTDYRARSQTVERLSAFTRGQAGLLEGREASTVVVIRATADLFAAMGQHAHLGRLFMEGDDQAGRPQVAVLGHRYWQQVMGADASVIGRTVQLGRVPHTIVGVLRPGIEVGSLALVDMWVPLVVDPTGPRGDRQLRVLGRLRAGVSAEQAASEFAAIGDALAREYPETNAGWRGRLVPISAAMGGENFWIVIALFGLSVTLVICIACANVANLLLARAIARRREMAMRSALGATRWRNLRQVLAEGVLLAVAAGTLAVAIAEALLRAVRAVDSEPVFKQLRVDGHELAFIGAIVLVGPLLFALIPAWLSYRGDLRGALNEGGARAGGTRGRGRAVLVATQLALAVVLLTTAGLAVRSALAVSLVETGMRTDGLLKFEMDFDEQQYPDSRLPQVVDQLRARLVSLPGVAGMGALDRLLVVSGDRTVSLRFQGRAVPLEGAEPWALQVGVSADALGALGVPMLGGRPISRNEEATLAPVALLGREAAARYFETPGQAIGQVMEVIEGDRSTSRMVVGLVGDVLTADLERGAQPRIWVPLGAARHVALVVRGHGDVATLGASLRRAVGEVAPTVPIVGLETYETALRRQRSSDHVVIGIFAGFSLVALALAATGLFGVVSYSVSQRTAEFGTRFALGARGIDVLAMVMRESLRVLAIGLSAGLAGGLLVATAIRGVLYGVTPLDPLNIVGVMALLGVTALIASIVPAARAARVDLVTALRRE